MSVTHAPAPFMCAEAICSLHSVLPAPACVVLESLFQKQTAVMTLSNSHHLPLTQQPQQQSARIYSFIASLYQRRLQETPAVLLARVPAGNSSFFPYAWSAFL
jgi:hypothetical protein